MATQRHSEFALHARAILGYELHNIERHSSGASAAFKSPENIDSPVFYGVEDLFKLDKVDLRIFSKPNANVGRRMAVVLASEETAEKSVELAKKAREFLKIKRSIKKEPS